MTDCQEIRVKRHTDGIPKQIRAMGIQVDQTSELEMNSTERYSGDEKILELNPEYHSSYSESRSEVRALGSHSMPALVVASDRCDDIVLCDKWQCLCREAWIQFVLRAHETATKNGKILYKIEIRHGWGGQDGSDIKQIIFNSFPLRFTFSIQCDIAIYGGASEESGGKFRKAIGTPMFDVRTRSPIQSLRMAETTVNTIHEHYSATELNRTGKLIP